MVRSYVFQVGDFWFLGETAGKKTQGWKKLTWIFYDLPHRRIHETQTRQTRGVWEATESTQPKIAGWLGGGFKLLEDVFPIKTGDIALLC